MRHYYATRTPGGCAVEVLDSSHPSGGYALEPRHDLFHFSPSLDFGNSGPGTTQLALALLADAVGDTAAVELAPAFKRRVLAGIEGDSFEMSQEDLVQEAARLQPAQARGRV